MKYILAASLTLILSYNFANAAEESLWAKSNFSYKTLAVSVNDKTCSNDEMTFFGCLEAIKFLLSQKGYTVSTAQHKPLPNATLFKTVGAFQILKLNKSTTPIDKASALRLITQEREKDRQDDEVWNSMASSGQLKNFDQLLQETMTITGHDNEKDNIGYATNAFLEQAVDPHTHFMPNTQLTKMQTQEDNITGIGASLRDYSSGAFIIGTYPNSPARKVGLQSGDIITAVNGTSIKGKALEDSIKMILGPINSPVNITIQRHAEAKQFTIVRNKVVKENVYGEIVNTTSSAKVGYIRIDGFMNEQTCTEFDNWLKKFQTMDGVIVDLRGNGGGNLAIVQCTLSAIMDPGQIIISEINPASNALIDTFASGRSPVQFRNPLAVLVDQHTASASEIFAGVVQDDHLGFIVGDKTYGKGTVQTLLPPDKFMPGLGDVTFAATTGRFHLPSGRSNQVVGIIPDFQAFIGPTPEDFELMSFREADIMRFPISPGAPVEIGPHPRLAATKDCVAKTGKALASYNLYGDYAEQVAVDVIACQKQ